jgi:hypothetical protein
MRETHEQKLQTGSTSVTHYSLRSNAPPQSSRPAQPLCDLPDDQYNLPIDVHLRRMVEKRQHGSVRRL